MQIDVVGIITVIGVCVAVVQLHLQKLEYRRTGKINSLVFVGQHLKYEISRNEAIIADLKKQGKSYKKVALKVNTELLPQLTLIHENLIALSKDESINKSLERTP